MDTHQNSLTIQKLLFLAGMMSQISNQTGCGQCEECKAAAPEETKAPRESLIQKARAFAEKAHANQKRSDGKPYFTHLEQVALIVDKEWKTLAHPDLQKIAERIPLIRERILAAAFLHDYLEDAEFTQGSEQALQMECFDLGIVALVKSLTRPAVMSYSDYISSIAALPGMIGHAARLIKLADLKHNLSDHPPGARRDKYELAQKLITA